MSSSPSLRRTLFTCAAFLFVLRPLMLRSQAPQPHRTENVILVVTDGFRWQEVFTGADASLMGKAGNVNDSTALHRDFWRDTPDARREALLPFIWGTINKRGQLFGDSAGGSVMSVMNTFRFSYPGYSEMSTGHADPRINSNEHQPNENLTVFEWLNAQSALKGKVAVFGTWNAFNRIFNAERSGLPIYDGWERGATPLGTPRALTMRDLYATTTRYWTDVAFDALMHYTMTDYLQVKKPRVLFIGYGETDEWAHGGRYDLYLRSVHQVDEYLAQLWKSLQADPQYRDKTTLIITTDHGRGYGARWRDHGEKVEGAQFVWTAIIGPDIPARGVRRDAGDVHQAQIASTIAALLGYDWHAKEPLAQPALPIR